jgi:hypothetical protein
MTIGYENQIVDRELRIYDELIVRKTNLPEWSEQELVAATNHVSNKELMRIGLSQGLLILRRCAKLSSHRGWRSSEP